MRESVVTFQNVYKSYPFYHHVRGVKNFLFDFPRNLNKIQSQQYEALRDINFEVYRGEKFGIIGNNGAGKSTALGLIAGVLKPTKGRVVVRGRISPLLALGAGFHPELNGRENIVLNGVLMGLTRREVQRKMDEIIEFAELAEFIDQQIRVYSSGMVARLGFSVVAHLDPEILLIDEVLGVGDIRFQRKCVKKMQEFRGSDTTMILVSHSLPSVVNLCDRALWIEDHQVRMMGNAQEIAENYCKSAGVEMDLNPQKPVVNTEVTNVIF